MKKFKVYYEGSNGELYNDIITADGFEIIDGILVFYDRFGGTTNIAAYKNYLRVVEHRV